MHYEFHDRLGSARVVQDELATLSGATEPNLSKVLSVAVTAKYAETLPAPPNDYLSLCTGQRSSCLYVAANRVLFRSPVVENSQGLAQNFPPEALKDSLANFWLIG